jgi:hypothetical protein
MKDNTHGTTAEFNAYFKQLPEDEKMVSKTLVMVTETDMIYDRDMSNLQ